MGVVAYTVMAFLVVVAPLAIALFVDSLKFHLWVRSWLTGVGAIGCLAVPVVLVSVFPLRPAHKLEIRQTHGVPAAVETSQSAKAFDLVSVATVRTAEQQSAR